MTNKHEVCLSLYIYTWSHIFDLCYLTPLAQQPYYHSSLHSFQVFQYHVDLNLSHTLERWMQQVLRTFGSRQWLSGLYVMLNKKVVNMFLKTLVKSAILQFHSYHQFCNVHLWCQLRQSIFPGLHLQKQKKTINDTISIMV